MKSKSAGKIRFVKASYFVRRLRGGSQPCLIRCDDGSYYVVKMRGNPQGKNVLANEWIGAAMVRSVGLRVPESVIVELSAAFIEQNRDIFFNVVRGEDRPPPGLHFGSSLIRVNEKISSVVDYLPYSQRVRLNSGPAFVGIALHDLLAEHCDTRQMVYSREPSCHTTQVTFIDFGHYFRGPSWERSSLKEGLIEFSMCKFPQLWNNQSIINRWLTTFRSKLPKVLSEAVATVPPHWSEGDLVAMHSHYQSRIETFSDVVTHHMSQRATYSLPQPVLSSRRAQL